MYLKFHPRAWEDYNYWCEHNAKLRKRIYRLITEVQRTPFYGTGKPEALKGDLQGAWSRRINQEHRMVYVVDNEEVIILLRLRGHYTT